MSNSQGKSPATEPEVLEKPRKRSFDAAYKSRILAEADRCVQSGEIGALLRREGLYASHLATWRRQREQGALAALASRRRGRKPRRQDPVAQENARLERENRRLAERLRQAETIIEVQKKVSELLGISPNTPNSAGSNS